MSGQNPDNFKTPVSRLKTRSATASTATKRDSLAAELERDPQLSTAKRLQRNQVFTSTLSHASLERQLLAAQTTTSELTTKLREKELQVERLERDRRYFADREETERAARQSEREEYETAKRKQDQELRTLRATVTALKEEKVDLEEELGSLKGRAERTIKAHEAKIHTLEHRVELLEGEVREAQQIADERSKLLANLQRRMDELEDDEVVEEEEMVEERHETPTKRHTPRRSLPPSSLQDMEIIRSELSRQTNHMRGLESMNAKLSSELSYLRERNQSIQVLQEEKRGLEARLEVMASLRERVVKLEKELEDARSAFQAQPSSSSGSTSLLAQELERLRLAHAQLLEEHGKTSAALTHHKALLDQRMEMDAEATQRIRQLEADVRRLEQEVARREARLKVGEREVGYLNALLASYKAEEAYASENPTPVIDAVKLKHLGSLEELLQEYKLQNDQLANDVGALQARVDAIPETPPPPSRSTTPPLPPTATTEELQSLKAQNAELQEEVERLQKTLDDTEQELFDLKGEVAGGRHVPPNTRVIKMAEDPDQAWLDARREVVEALRRENGVLLERLKDLEARAGASGASSSADPTQGGLLVPRESYELLERQTNDLKNEIAQKEKRLLRLQQVFSSKSQEFREAIASVLGLKLAFYPNGQVRVTSVYDLNASFIFQPLRGNDSSDAGSMKMQLVAQGEGGPQDLPNLMHYWIESEQCTPGFLASVTLECYESWKRNGGGEEQQ